MTIVYLFLLQGKLGTQTQKGGNTKEFYGHEGTKPKSELLKQVYPEYTRLVERWGRPHHHVDYPAAARCKRLIKDLNAPPLPSLNLALRKAGGAK